MKTLSAPASLRLLAVFIGGGCGHTALQFDKSSPRLSSTSLHPWDRYFCEITCVSMETHFVVFDQGIDTSPTQFERRKSVGRLNSDV